jgi:hypothetical protein
MFLEQEIRRICETNAWTIGALNLQADHVHLFLSAPPSASPSQIAHTLKGTTARQVFQRFPEVKKQLWGGAFWSRSNSSGQRRRYECGDRAQIDRGGTGLRNIVVLYRFTLAKKLI